MATKEREDALNSRADDNVYQRMSVALTREMKDDILSLSQILVRGLSLKEADWVSDEFANPTTHVCQVPESNGASQEIAPIKVLLRMRPLFEEEVKIGALSVATCKSTTEVSVEPMESYLKPRMYTFDRVFGSHSTQQEVYRVS